MIIFCFIIPIITCIILAVWFRKETVWWEYLVVFFPSLVSTLIAFFAIQGVKTHDTHYTSSRIVKVRFYEDWDEWIHRTCYRTVKVGKTSHSVPYDCSYRDYHSEYYVAIDKKGRETIIKKDLFDHYVSLWGGKDRKVFKDMNRNYYREDGDAYDYSWDNKSENSFTISKGLDYKNYFQNSRSLYSLEEISDKDAESLGLYKYPSKNGYIPSINKLWNFDQEVILTSKSKYAKKIISEKDMRLVWDLNSINKNFRVLILFFPENASISIVDKQRSYWKGGNDNELVVCISTTLQGTIRWLSTFSWSNEPRLESNLKNTILPGREFKMDVLIDEIRNNYYSHQWIPLDFSKYSYISPELCGVDYIILIVITVIINIALSIYVITNNYKNPD